MSNSRENQAASHTFAFIVGIEIYDLGKSWDLPGCIAEAKRFHQWVLDNKVAEKNIFLHLSPPDSDRTAHHSAIMASVKALKDRAQKDSDSDVLLIYWSGHGYEGEQKPHVYFTDSDTLNQGLDLFALIDYVGSEEFGFCKLFAFVDACDSTIQGKQFPAVPLHVQCTRTCSEKYVHFACSVGEAAKSEEGEGLFSKELFEELKNRRLPLEIATLDNSLRSRFNELRENSQNPWCYWARDAKNNLTTWKCDSSVLVKSYLEKVEKQFEECKEEIFPLTTQPGRMKPFPRQLHKELMVLEELQQQGLLPASSGLPEHPTLDCSRDTIPIEKIPQYIATCGRIVLLGAPGSGKSTLLHYLFYQFAHSWQETAEDKRTALPKEYKDRVPVFVSLKHWKDREMDFITFLKEHVKTISQKLAKHLPTLMEKGQVVLLLDGLNEMPQLKRERNGYFMGDPRAKALAAFGNEKQFLSVWCVLSCRDKEFGGRPEWNDLHLRDLDPGQVRNFAKSMFPDDHVAKAFLNELDKSTDAFQQKLRRLVSVPFYLKQAILFYRKYKTLASSRWNLLTFTVETALRRKIEGRELTKDERNELNSRLSLLAFNMTDAEYVGGVDQEKATRWMFNLRDEEVSDNQVEATDAPTIEELAHAEDLWRWAKGTGLISMTPEGASFYHQLFQEYFCARYCSMGTFPLAGMLQRMTYPAFSEVWPLLAERDNNLVVKLSELLQDKVRFKDVPHALKMIGNDEAIRALIAALSDQRKEIRGCATGVIMGSPDINLITDLLTTTAERNPDGQVRRAARKAIKQIELKNASRPKESLSFLDRMRQRTAVHPKQQTSD
ncbi:MAG: hypothetical protein OJF51_002691 [Nitrospira sp.]|jgi:gas vesicle protein|nr:MAG: hypothetical protein OJF51_002691 [Nitrospira sp.]